MNISISVIIAFAAKTLTAAGIAYALLQLYGKKWLETQFSKKLEDHKGKINALFSRISKIHEKEFEVLPEAWRLLQHALGLVSALASPLKTYPDINRMNPAEFDGFLATTRLNDLDKKALASASDRNKFFQERIFWYDLQDAREAVNAFHNYTILNKIFMTKELFDAFKAVDDLLMDTILEQEIGTEAGDRSMTRNYYKTTRTQIEPLVANIEVLVQERLHHAEA
ncbi:MAG: hypothetical protein FD174_1416 [Geobacteraceae bacterium]|nr:MAG: hypothetical protein FD174_1416 [Geobacteraceae bacterium]